MKNLICWLCVAVSSLCSAYAEDQVIITFTAQNESGEPIAAGAIDATPLATADGTVLPHFSFIPLDANGSAQFSVTPGPYQVFYWGNNALPSSITVNGAFSRLSQMVKRTS